MLALLALALADGLVVHEWGTFTAVAGHDGALLDWSPLDGPSDLPDFVYTALDPGPGTRIAPPFQILKGRSTLRMETPVIYFYGEPGQTVDVRVDFPEGHVTEWYPRARSVGDGIDWGTIRLSPVTEASFPRQQTESHYFPARHTAAMPVAVCDDRGVENERFLFYRGTGDFDLSLAVRLDGDDVVLDHVSGVRAVVFERRGDRVGYTVLDADRDRVRRPTRDDAVADVLSALRAELVASGLFADEAAAMVETWEDQWFEEGLRVFYVLPRAETDAALPLHLDPAPEQVVRTMVGRIEVLTPEDGDRVLAALSRFHHADALVQRFGRFLEPLARDLGDARLLEVLDLGDRPILQ